MKIEIREVLLVVHSIQLPGKTVTLTFHMRNQTPGIGPCLQILSNSGKGSVSEVTQLCPTLCDPVDSSPPGSSVHGILQARILEWVAISFSRGSSQPRDQTQVSRIAGRCFIL